MKLDQFRRGFRAGVVATLVMSVPMTLARLTGTSPLPRPLPFAIVRNVLGEDAPKPIVAAAALVAHFAYGGSWGGLLAASSVDVSLKQGIGLGGGLWGLLGIALMPWLGWGRFGREESSRIAPMTLLVHVIYGAAVAVLLGRDEREYERGERPVAETDDTN